MDRSLKISTLLKAMLAGVGQKTLRQSFAAGALVALKERVRK